MINFIFNIIIIIAVQKKTLLLLLISVISMYVDQLSNKIKISINLVDQPNLISHIFIHITYNFYFLFVTIPYDVFVFFNQFYMNVNYILVFPCLNLR